MKTRITSVIGRAAMALLLVILAPSTEAWAQTNSPYQISSYNDLKQFAAIVNDGETNANAVLTADIEAEAEDKGWTPIGCDESHAYTGTFDGGNYTIKYLSNANVAQKPNCVGLFGYVGAAGKVKNVYMEDADLRVRNTDDPDVYVYAGAVAGYNEGELKNVLVKGNVNGIVKVCAQSYNVFASGNYNFYVSGIAGYSTGTIESVVVSGQCSISSASNIPNVNNLSYVGGLAGYNAGTVENSYSDGRGTIKAEARNDAYVGGLVGYNNTDAMLKDCENRGSADVEVKLKVDYKNASAGGIAGYNNGRIQQTRFKGTGAITATYNSLPKGRYYYAGAFAGWNGSAGTIEYCFCENSSSAITATGSSNPTCAGGFAGYNQGKIKSCYVSGSSLITAGGESSSNASYAGGFAGYNKSGNESNAEIRDCYVCGNANITATTALGGLVGYNKGDLKNLYTCASSSFTPSTTSGGVVGKNEGTMEYCYFNREMISVLYSCENGESESVPGLTTNEMTGKNALKNMNFEDAEDTWLDGLEYQYGGLTFSCYPHLKGFAYDETHDNADWPAVGPCVIDSYAKLKDFAEYVNDGNSTASARLTADIVATGTDWTPIGCDESHAYAGTFDGGGHTITGLTGSVDMTAAAGSSAYAGLFGYIGSGGVVKYIGLHNVQITAKGESENDYLAPPVVVAAGAIAGYSAGTIQQCYLAGTGNVAGYGTCGRAGTMRVFAGGLVGSSAGEVQDCYSFGQTDIQTDIAYADHYNPTAAGQEKVYSGGLVGQSSGMIKNCYSANKGAITTAQNILAVSLRASDNMVMKKYFHEAFAGAIAGAVVDVYTVENVYYDQWQTDASRAIGNQENPSGAALTTNEMTAGTLTDVETSYVENMPGFLSDNWLVRPNEIGYYFYPHLRGFEYDNTATIENWPPKVTDIDQPQSQGGGDVALGTLTLSSNEDLGIAESDENISTIDDRTIKISNIPIGTNIQLRLNNDTSGDCSAVWGIGNTMTMEDPLVLPLTDNTEVDVRILRGNFNMIVEAELTMGNLTETKLMRAEEMSTFWDGQGDIPTESVFLTEIFNLDSNHRYYREGWRINNLPYNVDEYSEALNYLTSLIASHNGVTVKVVYTSCVRVAAAPSDAGNTVLLSEDEPRENTIFTATPAEGYSFLQWEYTPVGPGVDPGDAAFVSTENPLTLAVQNRPNGLYTARFTPTTSYVTMNEKGIRTYANTLALDFTGISGLTAYVVSDFDGTAGTLTLSTVGAVPAGTGLLLKGTADTQFAIPVVASASAPAQNYLVGVTDDATVVPVTTASNTNFILVDGDYGIDWYTLSGDGPIGANKAYLSLPTASLNLNSNASGFTWVYDDGTTSLNEELRMKNEEFAPAAGWFSLDGRKLSAKPTQKGIYIHNGKKRVVK